MKVPIPFTGTELDTDEPGDSAKEYGGLVAGFVALIGAVAGGTYAWSRIKNMAGVDGNTIDVEGV